MRQHSCPSANELLISAWKPPACCYAYLSCLAQNKLQEGKLPSTNASFCPGPPTRQQPCWKTAQGSRALLLYPPDQAINDLLVQLHFLLCSFKDEVGGEGSLQREIHCGYFPGYRQLKATECPCGKEQERGCVRKSLTLSLRSLLSFRWPNCSGHIKSHPGPLL